MRILTDLVFHRVSPKSGPLWSPRLTAQDTRHGLGQASEEAKNVAEWLHAEEIARRGVAYQRKKAGGSEQAAPI